MRLGVTNSGANNNNDLDIDALMASQDMSCLEAAISANYENYCPG